MRKLSFYLVFILILSSQVINAQDIFKQHGFDKKPLTLSNGHYNEFFNNDKIVQIGTILLNTQTNQIIAFVDEDTTRALYLADLSSRWLSPDPLAAKYPQVSPYVFCSNNPINIVDLDGREGIVVSGQPGDHQGREHFLVNGLDRATAMAAQYNKAGGGEKVTWFIYNNGGEGGYDAKTIQKYQSLAGKAGINIQVVSDASDIVDYVNDKNGGNSRSQDLVSKFSYLGHATPGDLDVGFVDHGAWNLLTNDKIEPSDFSSDAFKSGSVVDVVGGCRTAVDGNLPGEQSVIDQFSNILDIKSIIYGSDVKIGYMGGVRTDNQLVKYKGTDGKQVNGHVVQINGKKEEKK